MVQAGWWKYPWGTICSLYGVKLVQVRNGNLGEIKVLNGVDENIALHLYLVSNMMESGLWRVNDVI